MRNRFTITISDVYGAKQYSFRQVVKRFAVYLILLIAGLWLLIAGSLFWALETKDEIESKHQHSVELYGERLFELQESFNETLLEKQAVESSVETLGKQIQGLEELVMGGSDLPPVENVDLEERLRNLQSSAIGQQYLLMMLPNGSAVEDYRGISSSYGMRIHPVTGKRKMHYGIDYKSRQGDAVIATAEGVVMFAGYTDSGFGKMVTIAHANGFKTRYGHLSKINVKLGQFIEKGQKLGEVGTTGLSTGAHLHYEVLFLSKRLNPRPFNDWSLTNFKQIFTEVKQVPWASFVQAVNFKVRQVEKLLLPEVPKSVESSSI
ncbi:M23 family metallopeptidase [Thiomicrorhabdus indica]|uniref:M23 family metallopeptidase n=1 Tax=Thiomicrorhabdus indica TaxID=2267253 RepID=UPI00102DAC09|nr:M23 family metallopeptidase [Thiomicrorhabdus indica]